jgi:ribosome biogenesis GTPase / thiamine phosphate phosphatase
MDNTVLENFGFDVWFQKRTDLSKWPGCGIARVVAVDKNSYVVSDGERELFAETTGKLAFHADSPMDLPAVGDWVAARFFDGDTFAVIHGIVPRKSFLRRKTPGKRVEFQMIAANVDAALIIQSLDADFNVRRLERYLVMANEGAVIPVLLLSKSDLLASREIDDRKAEIQGLMPGMAVVSFSNTGGSGLDGVRDLLVPQKTYCLLGSSGVGKTTLLNNLAGGASFETKAVREKDGKGRHVTTRRQLIVLKNGAMLVDTPGMRELGMLGSDSGVDDTFDEMVEWSKGCRFNDCTHTVEKGCAVLAALENGQLRKERYLSYLKLRRESEYHAMSYVEKRRKDKQFGKMIKSVLNMKNRGK